MSNPTRITVVASLLVLGTGTLAACGSSSGSSATSSPASTTVQVTNQKVAEPMGEMTALYGDLTNPGPAEVTLTACSTPVAGECQIHEVVKTGNVEKMQQLPGGLPIPAGSTVALKSGSYHVMLMNLKNKLAVGDQVEVTLTFTNGPVQVSAPVTARMADSSASPGM